MLKSHANDNEPAPPNEIFQALQDATSQDPARLQQSAQKLKDLEERLGTWDVIHQVASQTDLPLNLRQMAMLQFKNGAVTRWKSRRTYEDTHRNAIKARSFQFLHEQDDTIADCNAITVGKIARADFPASWPNLVIDLCTIVQNNLQALTSDASNRNQTILVMRRALENLNTIVKEISGIRMMTGVRTMVSLLNGLYPILLESYFNFWGWVTQRLETYSADGLTLFELIRLLHSFYKPLSKLMTWLWTRTEKTETKELAPLVPPFFAAFIKQWRTLYDLRRQMIGSAGLEKPLEYLTKHLMAVGKTFRKWQRADARRFVHLGGTTDFVNSYWQIVVESVNSSDGAIDSPLASYPIRLIVLGMVLFRDCLPQWSPLRTGKVDSNPLSEAFVKQAIELLVTRFMPLTENDLVKWFDDPEVWSLEEGKDNDAWEYEIRPCSERVLIVFSRQYPEIVVPMLRSSFDGIISMPTSSIQDIVTKEAVYCAVGCCSTSLVSTINLKERLQTSIASEITSDVPQARVLKRRIAWLIGKWLGDVGNEVVDTIVWDILTRLVSDHGHGSDASVRLAAAAASRSCVDSVGFDLEHLKPYLGLLVTGLLQNLCELDAPESKQAVMGCLTIVVEQSGKEIAPYTKPITDALPAIWTQAEELDDASMKAAVVCTMIALIKSLKEDAHHLLPIAIPLLQSAFAPKNKIQIDEDAFELWQALLRNIPSLETPVGQSSPLELFPFAIHCLSNDLDLLGSIVRIVESYFLLDAPNITQGFAIPLFSACKSTLAQAIATNAKALISALGLLFSLTPAPLWAEALLSTGLFSSMLQTFLDDKIGAPVLAEYLFMFARMAIADAHAFVKLVSAVAPSITGHGANDQLLMNELLDQWWIKFDTLCSPRQSKLTAMGVTALVPTANPLIMQKLPSDIFNMWMDCFRELKEVQREADELDDTIHKYWELSDNSFDEFIGDAVGTVEESRRKKVWDQDPVQSIALTTYVASKLNETQAVLGGPAALEVYFNQADPIIKQDVLKALQ